MFAVIFIPRFPLQALLRHEPELAARPLGLIEGGSSEPKIIQATDAAQAQGVELGLTSSQAKARCAELLIKARSLPQEETATDILIQTALAFSPHVESTAQGICTIETKGLRCDTDPVATEVWAADLVQALASLNLHAQLGCASTPSLALLAARAAHPVLIVQPSSEFVSRLPVEDLDLSAGVYALLKRWGIRSVGELLALGKEALSERLGPAALEIFARLSPQSVRPLKVVTAPERFEERIEFEHEIETAEPLLFVLQRIIEQFSRRLAIFSLVVAEIELQLGLSSGATYARTFAAPAPTRDITTLVRMLQTHLETVRTDAPIIWLCLAAKPCHPEQHQFGLFETTLRDPNQFTETLARLSGLLGADRVGQPVPEKTHRPDAFHLERPNFTHHFGVALAEEPADPRREGLPLRRFRPPCPVTVEFQNERPIRFQGTACRAVIAAARGPFCTSGEWWDTQRWEREEWDVQAAEGTLYRLCRSPQGCFVEGVYD